MRVKDAVGRFGEDLAVRHMVDGGARIVARNWRCREGELDVVALEGETLAFVEVKTRSTAAFGDPAEAVSPAKAARIRRLAVLWLAEHPAARRELGFRAVRFDVVSVLRRSPDGPSLRHLRGAF